MKYSIIMSVCIIIFAGCKTNDDTCRSRLAFNADNFKIENTFKSDLSHGLIDSVLAISKKRGIKIIDSIQIGMYYLPSGKDPDVIFVYERGCMQNNNRELRQRKLTLKLKNWDRFNSGVNDQIKFVEINEYKHWRFVIGPNILNIYQDISLNYNEAKEILSMVNQEKYLLRCNIGELNLQRDIDKISRIIKDGNKYTIYYDFNFRWPSLFCLKKNDKLIITRMSVIVT